MKYAATLAAGFVAGLFVAAFSTSFREQLAATTSSIPPADAPTE